MASRGVAEAMTEALRAGLRVHATQIPRRLYPEACQDTPSAAASPSTLEISGFIHGVEGEMA